MGYRLSRYNYGTTQSNLDGNFIIPMISTGNGTGVSTLKLAVNEKTSIGIDGNGTFYTDAAGTLGASKVVAIASGATITFYLKVTSGTCNVTVFKGNMVCTQLNEWTSSTNAASINGMNLSALPSAITYFYCTGSNTITGNLSSLPSVMTYFYCQGSNTITGSLSSLPSVMTSFYCQGLNTIQDYTGKVWASNMRRVYLRSDTVANLSAAQNDQLLIDLNNAGGTWNSEKQINLKGTRTTASDAAVTALGVKGVSVTVN
jgi:hypothetical protein